MYNPIPIPDLPATAAPNGADAFPLVQSSVTKKSTLTDLLDFHGVGALDTSYVKVSLSADQAMSASGWRTVLWTTEDSDTDGYFNPASNTIITVPAGRGGIHLVYITVELQDSGFTSDGVLVEVMLNGVTKLNQGTTVDADGGVNAEGVITILAPLDLVAADELLVRIYPGASTSLLDTSLTYFSLLRVDS